MNDASKHERSGANEDGGPKPGAQPAATAPCAVNRPTVIRVPLKPVLPEAPDNRDSLRSASWRAKRSLRGADNGADGDRDGPARCRKLKAVSDRPIGGPIRQWTDSIRAGAGVRDTPEAGQKVPPQKWPRSRAPRPAMNRAAQREHADGRNRPRAGVAGRAGWKSSFQGSGAVPDCGPSPLPPTRPIVGQTRFVRSVRAHPGCDLSYGANPLVPTLAKAAPANLTFFVRSKVFRFHSNAFCVTQGSLAVGGEGPVR